MPHASALSCFSLCRCSSVSTFALLFLCCPHILQISFKLLSSTFLAFTVVLKLSLPLLIFGHSFHILLHLSVAHIICNYGQSFQMQLLPIDCYEWINIPVRYGYSHNISRVKLTWQWATLFHEWPYQCTESHLLYYWHSLSVSKVACMNVCPNPTEIKSSSTRNHSESHI